MAADAEPMDADVLILAPLGRDAQSIARLLAPLHYRIHVCDDITDLTERIGPGVGMVVITEESLARGTPQSLFDKLENQPAWSDLPFIYLSAPSRALARPPAPQSTLPRGLGNGIVLERPLGTQSLVSAIEWGLASRRRQYQIRDQLDQLREQTRQLSEAADKVRESESRFRAITESMPQIVWSARADGYHDYFNQRFRDFTGVTISGQSTVARPSVVHPDDRAVARAAWSHSLRSGEVYHVEYRMRHRSGMYRWQLAQAIPVREDGLVVRWFGTCTDIDDQVRARETLTQFNERLEHDVDARTVELEREMAERQRVEAELRQAHKMDAIGQLTGGIAHDFNNFLTGVIGSLDIAKRRIATGRTEDIARFMEVASSSAQRAASLTHRLLAFSRQQTLQPGPVDINALVVSMRALVSGSVDERVVIEESLDTDLALAVADENQVESALLNLVINARDAMPNGGVLTIATRCVTIAADGAGDGRVGRYVELAVADTGVGMSPEVLSRSTEPFFTTKPIGKGTGLGLSTIYGFARQSNGHLAIDSAEGVGTTIRLRLPVAVEEVAAAVAHEAPDATRGVGERILVVEDDHAVRMLVVDVLSELGYEAIEADDAGAALETIRTDQQIDLMISDVGLPGMNGRQLADIARSHRPGLRVLFMTGYAGAESVRLATLDDGMAVMTKPFEVAFLAKRIQQLMR